MSLPKQMGARRENESRSRMNASQYQNYLESKTVQGMEIYCEGTSKDWVEDFSLQARLHGKKNNTIAIEYVESWNPEETQKMGCDKLYEIGIENAQKAFPGHSFVVVPHINKNGNFHTHVLFCPVSDEGKRMYSNFDERARWNKTVDRNSIKNGLTTVRRGPSLQPERLSRSSHRMLRRGRKIPHQLQIMHKADFARKLAASLDDFIDIMDNFGITVNDRGKTISYLHPDREKPIRGKTLGSNYQKEGLQSTFERNFKEQVARPALRQHYITQMEQSFDENGKFIESKCDFPFHHGGHQKFTKDYKNVEIDKGKVFKKECIEYQKLSPFKLIFPLLKEAGEKSIPKYCDKNGIALIPQEDGTHRLLGRQNILISHNKWRNTKIQNGQEIGTSGNLIEFVANHRNCTLLQAVAHITNNKRLLILEQQIGEIPRDYKEFSVPKQGSESPKNLGCLLTKLVAHKGYSSDVARNLKRNKNVQVLKDSILFILGKSNKDHVEYKPGQKRGWLKTVRGNYSTPFVKQRGTKDTLTVYNDPFCFYSQNRFGLMGHTRSDNVLVLADDSSFKAIDDFIIENIKVNKINFIGFDKYFLSPEKRQQLEKFNITFSFLEKLERSRDRGLELSL